MIFAGANILILEDDDAFAALLAETLACAGYGAVRFSAAVPALDWAKRCRPDLVISDIRLGKVSGLEFCAMLKASPALSSVPVMMLSAYGDEEHKVRALRGGADDYVVKPCSGTELLARVEAILRRTYHGCALASGLAGGSLTLDFDARDGKLNGKPLGLLLKEYALLAMFLSNRGRVLSFGRIGEEVWGENSIATRENIKVHVHRLRRKLGCYCSCLEAVPGIGYRWRDAVRSAPEDG